ncbi:ATP-dependent metallopeptidase FtsH/Yme1/Tma family protein [Candidatus Peregrinibacteria bacterium]|jgi:cell division protease FtsH|nr:ATP-dependent metallopeptidase FtsH/Yme1/Tma family protein [Candidatus Peregrinibacteria bacterium]
MPNLPSKPPVRKLPQRPKSNNLLYLIISALLLTTLYFMFNPAESNVEIVPLSEFVDSVEAGEVYKIQVAGNEISFTEDSEIAAETEFEFYTIKESSANVTELLADIDPEVLAQVEIEIIDLQASNFWRDVLIGLVPFAIIIGFFLFMMRQAQSSNSQAMSFGKSKARSNDSKKNKTKFKDVAGAVEAKNELEEIVDFLKTPKKYTKMGAKIPRGVVLIGPPGCGKTLLARAVSGEADVPFFNISGSEFVEMFVGVGASRVRDLFKRAKRNAPCIIFIDEIDAVGRQRGAGLGGGHDEREQTLNQILTEMDGFEQGTNVIVMAATNRPDVLDPALLRPGRFDRRVIVDRPDLKAREAILKVHSKNKPLTKTANLKKIAQQTPGFSGADLENLLNEAAILAAKLNQKKVTQKHIESSIEKVVMGPERKSRAMNKEERKITAYHEVGHALAGHYSPKCDPVHKISIVSRGMSLGATWFLPEEDKHLSSRSKFMDEIISLMGGYTAEELIFGEMTTGASNDLERASKLARKMVTEFGMSTLGPIIYGEANQEVFLGRDFGRVRNFSEKMAAEIDAEVEKIVKEGYEASKKVLKKHLKEMHKIAATLIEKETLTQQEFLNFLPKKTWKKSEIKAAK